MIFLDDKNFEKDEKLPLGHLAFILLHEMGHLRQHEKMGLLHFAEKLRSDLKSLESDADKFAISHFCKKCKQVLEEKIINIFYTCIIIEKKFCNENLHKMYVSLGFQSKEDFEKK